MPPEQQVRGIICDDGKLLLVQGSHFSDVAGMWELPGGSLEGKETPLQGIERLVTEQLGVVVTDVQTRGTYFSELGGKKRLTHVFAIIVESMGFTLSKRHIEAKWFEKQGIMGAEVLDKAKVMQTFRDIIE